MLFISCGIVFQWWVGLRHLPRPLRRLHFSGILSKLPFPPLPVTAILVYVIGEADSPRTVCIRSMKFGARSLSHPKTQQSRQAINVCLGSGGHCIQVSPRMHRECWSHLTSKTLSGASELGSEEASPQKPAASTLWTMEGQRRCSREVIQCFVLLFKNAPKPPTSLE